MSSQSGTDLKVIPYFVAHDASQIDLLRRSRVAPVLRGVTGPKIPGAEADGNGMVHDLDIMTDRENLAQALILRLLTPRGSLAALGHAEYGSRIHELIGKLKPRVENKAVEFSFDPLQEGPSSLVFTLAVRPVNGEEPIGLSLEVAI